MDERHAYTPAALYARVSSDRQDVDLSVAAQLRALRDYARKNDYVIVREYVDLAESGRIADRPQFRKMDRRGYQARDYYQHRYDVLHAPMVTALDESLIDFCQNVVDIFHLHRRNWEKQSHGVRRFMLYERARQIEMRFQEAVRLIADAPLNAQQLAAALGVSTSTVQRVIAELRRRGYSIRSVHDPRGWRV